MGLGIDMGTGNHGTVTPDMLEEEGESSRTIVIIFTPPPIQNYLIL